MGIEVQRPKPFIPMSSGEPEWKDLVLHPEITLCTPAVVNAWTHCENMVTLRSLLFCPYDHGDTSPPPSSG